jgi:hypothetical protein
MQFALGKKCKQAARPSELTSQLAEQKKCKIESISITDNMDWSSLREKANVMVSLNSKADFATVSKVLDLYSKDRTTSLTPTTSMSLCQTMLKGNTLTRSKACKAENSLGSNIKRISIPPLPPKLRLTKASTIPLPKNSARIVMFWLVPGKVAPTEASSLDGDKIQHKLTAALLPHLPGKPNFASSLAVERIKWVADHTALRV